MAQQPKQVATVVTKREETPRPAIAHTPDTVADVKVKPMPALAIVGIRALRVYVQSLLGFLGAGSLGLASGILPTEFGPLVWTAVQLALAPATLSVLQNTLELLTKLDQTLPEIRA